MQCFGGVSCQAHMRWFRAASSQSLAQVHLRSLAFIETRGQPPAGSTAVSHQYLEQAGFVKQSAAGVFMMLPMGLRVMERIEAVIDREMQAVGGHKLQMPQLLSADQWKVTGRWTTAGQELFRLQDRKVGVVSLQCNAALIYHSCSFVESNNVEIRN
jgi:prolyl-tRNA synthetase